MFEMCLNTARENRIIRMLTSLFNLCTLGYCSYTANFTWWIWKLVQHARHWAVRRINTSWVQTLLLQYLNKRWCLPSRRNIHSISLSVWFFAGKGFLSMDSVMQLELLCLTAKWFNRTFPVNIHENNVHAENKYRLRAQNIADSLQCHRVLLIYVIPWISFTNDVSFWGEKLTGCSQDRI